MANETIKSLADAQKKISELQKQVLDYETQIKELQHRGLSFVDNPANPINRPFTPKDESVLYIPTLDKNRHFGMKFSDLCRYFDKYHLPVYFDNEEACSIFDSVFPVLNDLIKFKVMFDSGTPITPSGKSPAFIIKLDQKANKFTYYETLDFYTSVYFSSLEIAENCCTWLNYKYGFGSYSK